MSLPVPELNKSIEVLENVAGRFTTLLRTADPARTAIGRWSTAELATHVSMIFMMYPDLVRGGSSPVKDHLAMAAYWDDELVRDTLRDPAEAADRIDLALKEFAAAVGPGNWEQPVKWHGGKEVPVYTLASILLNECSIHGRDIATAEARPWSISRNDANLIFDGHLPILKHFVNTDAIKEMDASYEVHLRGGSTVYFEISGGQLEIRTSPSRSVDCRISADPVTYLMVGYGRTGQWGPVLTGKILAFGKKPWLGMRLATLFHSA